MQTEKNNFVHWITDINLVNANINLAEFSERVLPEVIKKSILLLESSRCFAKTLTGLFLCEREREKFSFFLKFALL